MASFFIILLLVSLAGMVMLMTLKQIELSTGSILFASMRPKVNRFFKTCLIMVERVLPGLVKGGIAQMFLQMRALMQKALAHAILRFEEWLKSMLHLIREKTHPAHARGEASAFLRQVGEYKKQIETENKEDHAIFDESVSDKK